MNEDTQALSRSMRDTAHPLVINLNHSFLRTDLRYEAFWRRMTANLAQALVALARRDSQAGGKQRVEAGTEIDCTLLPVHTGVLARLRAAQAKGRAVALASASDSHWVKAIADCYGVTQTFASDGETNLKGPATAEALCAVYGSGGFDYVGDSEADFAVWDHAARILVVDPSSALLAKVQARYGTVEVVRDENPATHTWFHVMRPHQWVKNLLLFLPALAAHSASELAWGMAALGCAAFCLGASGLYIINDLLDLDADRLHASKRHRPIAAGRFPIRHAMALSAGLLTGACLLALVMGPLFALVLLGYLVATLVYSGYLKRVVFLDMVLLSGFYVLRVLGGAVASAVPLSAWLVVFCFAFFLAVATVKRQTELTRTADPTAKLKGRGYRQTHTGGLTVTGWLAGGAATATLIAYGFSPSAAALYAQPILFSGVAVPVGIWLGHTLHAGGQGRVHDDPVIYAFKARASYVAVAVIVVIVAAAV